MTDSKRLPISLVLALLMVLPGLAWAQTERNTCTNNLLLPYFEVTPGSGDRTTVFVLTNTSDQTDKVDVQVADRNGTRVFRTTLDFKKFEEKAVDLRSWFQNGHLRLDKLKDPKRPDTAIGYVVFKGTRKAFCGNYYFFEKDGTPEDGEMLIHLPGEPCRRHAVFLRKAGVEDSDSRVTVWVVQGADKLTAFGYDKQGQRHELKTVNVTRTQILSLQELGWTPQSGIQWLELVNKDRSSFVVAHYLDPESHRGSMLRTCCFEGEEPPIPCTNERPSVSITKTTNGQARATDVVPGSTVNWAYVVENTGNVALRDVVVKDNPQPANLQCETVTTLAPGAKMKCQASGKAVSAPTFSNTATVTATSDGKAECRKTVRATATSGYTTKREPPPHCEEGRARLKLDKKTNGKNNAGQIDAGSAVTWTYVVTNNGQATIQQIRLVDSPNPGPITCNPDKTVLKPGESLTCTAEGTAVEGNFRNTATVTGVSECGKDVRATASSGYRGKAPKDDRFMTGGAFIRNTPHGKVDVQITKLNCDGSPPANLNVEWGGTGNQRQKFKLQRLISVQCSDTPGVEPGPPAASFDTAVGTGTGKVKGKNATISFKFVDAGEKGANRDQLDITITFDGQTIKAAGKIDGGDYQAHK